MDGIKWLLLLRVYITDFVAQYSLYPSCIHLNSSLLLAFLCSHPVSVYHSSCYYNSRVQFPECLCKKSEMLEISNFLISSSDNRVVNFHVQEYQ